MARRPTQKPTVAVKAPVVATTMPGANGLGTLNVGGNEGNRFGAGRKPNEFRRRMRELATLAQQQELAETIIRNPNHQHWPFAVKWSTERGYGPLPKPVEITGPGGGALVIRVVREG